MIKINWFYFNYHVNKNRTDYHNFSAGQNSKGSSKVMQVRSDLQCVERLTGRQTLVFKD